MNSAQTYNLNFTHSHAYAISKVAEEAYAEGYAAGLSANVAPAITDSLSALPETPVEMSVPSTPETGAAVPVQNLEAATQPTTGAETTTVTGQEGTGAAQSQTDPAALDNQANGVQNG